MTTIAWGTVAPASPPAPCPDLGKTRYAFDCFCALFSRSTIEPNVVRRRRLALARPVVGITHTCDCDRLVNATTNDHFTPHGRICTQNPDGLVRRGPESMCDDLFVLTVEATARATPLAGCQSEDEGPDR
jgi:hypothetical protein